MKYNFIADLGKRGDFLNDFVNKLHSLTFERKKRQSSTPARANRVREGYF